MRIDDPSPARPAAGEWILATPVHPTSPDGPALRPWVRVYAAGGSNFAGRRPMSPWNRICCAVDLSECTQLVVENAAHLAAWLHADLALLHVVAPVPPSALDLLPAVEDREIDTGARRELAGWRDEAQAITGRPVSMFVAHGHPAREILAYVGTHGVDALVVGTHGRRGFERLVLGSVAELVVRQASCPVVVIRASAIPSGDRAARTADVVEYS